MKQIETQIKNGDCLEVLKGYPDNFFDLIVTSPPYADSRAQTYGGIKPSQYVKWFSSRSEQFIRVLKPTGTFVLNIKLFTDENDLVLYHFMGFYIGEPKSA